MAKLTDKQHESQQDRRLIKLEKRADKDDILVKKLKKRIDNLEKQVKKLSKKKSVTAKSEITAPPIETPPIDEVDQSGGTVRGPGKQET